MDGRAWLDEMLALYRRYGEGMGRDPILQAIYILLLIQIAHLGGSLAGDLVVVVRTLVVLEVIRWVGRRFGMIERHTKTEAPSVL